MKKDWLDKKMTERFQDFDSQMDFESAWNQIENRRNKKRKRRFVFWLFFGGILALGSLFGTIYLVGSEEVVVANDYENIDDIPPHSNLSKNDQASINEGTEKTETENSLIQRDNSEISNEKPNDQSQVFAENKVSIPLINSKTAVLLKETQKTIPSSKGENPQSILLENDIELPSKLGLNPLSFIQTNFDTSIVRWASIHYSEVKEDWDEVPKKNSKPFYYGLTFTYGKNFQALDALSSDQIDWVNRRKKLENPLDAIYAEITLRKYLTEKIFVQSGLGFHQNTTRLTDNSEITYSQILDNRLVEIIRYSDGTREEVFGKKEVTFYETQQVKQYNRTRSFLIPILVGYDFELSENTGFSFSSGVSFSLYSNFDGKVVLDESSQGIYTNELGYKERFILNNQNGLDFYFKPNSKWIFSGGIQSIIGLSNWTEQLNFEEKYHFLGGKVSVLRMF